jgi:hypothetical protein
VPGWLWALAAVAGLLYAASIFGWWKKLRVA